VRPQAALTEIGGRAQKRTGRRDMLNELLEPVAEKVSAVDAAPLHARVPAAIAD
jgi:hypothetical protein